jgi:hypothetical protein
MTHTFFRAFFVDEASIVTQEIMHFAVCSLHMQKKAQIGVYHSVQLGACFDLAVLGAGYESSSVVISCVSFQSIWCSELGMLKDTRVVCDCFKKV